MAICAHCKTQEAQLYDDGVPVCLECSEKRQPMRKPSISDQIRRALVNEIVRATARVSQANQKFSEVTGRFPSGWTQPAAVQRIKNASDELTLTRKEMMTAHRRLNDFMDHGVVPTEDLEVKRATA